MKRKPSRATPRKRTSGETATLDRALSKLGFASRSKALSLIAEGRVRVGGQVCRDPGRWVPLARGTISVDGERVLMPPVLDLMMNKPRGIVTSRSDEAGRKTVYDLLGENARWVIPIGRLDRDSEGLLLFTNDTAFGEYLTNPASHLPKVYAVKIHGNVDDATLERLRASMDLGFEGRTRSAEVLLTKRTPKGAWLEVTLTEGKNRQIRRMMEAVGLEVEQLVRIRIGSLDLGELKKGEVRSLTKEESQRLRK